MCSEETTESKDGGKQKKRRRTVLQVHNFYKIPGGEDTVVENERKLLEECGCRVLQYTRHNKELDGMNLGEKLFSALGFLYSLRTRREVSELIRRERVDVVMVHNILTLISPSVYDAGISCGVPVVQVMHNFRLLCPNAVFYRDGIICEECVSKGLGCAVRHGCYRGSRMQTLIAVLSMKLARLRGVYGRISYICLTEFNRKKLLQLRGVRPDKAFVKPNFTEYTGDWIPYEERRECFVYAGRLDSLKGVKEILEAWRLLGDEAPDLLLCGSGPLMKECREYIEKYGLKQIVMRGMLSKGEVMELVGNAKALLMPTKWYEGFPMVITEAFAVGTPVIGSGFGNVGDLLSDGGDGAVTSLGVKIAPPISGREIAVAIGRFQAEFRYSEGAFREAARRYDSGENKTRLMEILEHVVSA